MNKILLWALRLIAAAIMIQTLYFKFTGAPEPVYIFTTLGMEPWGRIGTGIGELIASILILYPRTTALGSLMGIGLMAGAIFFHLTKLGIVVHVNGDAGDGGVLFITGVIVLVCCSILVYVQRHQLLSLLKKRN